MKSSLMTASKSLILRGCLVLDERMLQRRHERRGQNHRDKCKSQQEVNHRREPFSCFVQVTDTIGSLIQDNNARIVSQGITRRWENHGLLE